MKRLLLLSFVLTLLALDWAALHDILKGNETDYAGEYTALAASAVVIAALVWRCRRSAATNH